MISANEPFESPQGAQELGAISEERRILLESACVDLIGKFEQMLDAARCEREAGFLGESMVIGKKMMLALVEFADGYLEDKRLQNSVDVIAQACTLADEGVELSSSQSFGAVKRVFGRRTASDLEVANAHRSVGSAIASALSVAFNSAAQILGAARLSEDIRDSLEPMLAELREKW